MGLGMTRSRLDELGNASLGYAMIPSDHDGGGIAQVTDAQPLVVTILTEGDCLWVWLTDPLPIGRPARVRLGARQLGELRACATRVLRPKRSNGSPPAERGNTLHDMRELGRMVFSRLLPEPVRDFLAACPTRLLYLQIDEELLAIPWETAFDGENFLGEKFRISRRITSAAKVASLPAARHARDALRVLLVRGKSISPAHDAYCEGLLRRLRSIERLATTQAFADGLSQDETFRLLGACDVAHYVGPVRAAGARGADAVWWSGRAPVAVCGLAKLANPPQLLISENTELVNLRASQRSADLTLAKAAFGLGLNILIGESAIADEGSLGFMEQIYRELARGSALGEAARCARTATRRQDRPDSCCYPEAALYGDASLVVLPIDERSTLQEDNRRQVTIMACDLVESTRLLRTLGAEKYSDLLTRYRNLCATLVSGYGGFMEDPKGDGVLCFFGFPVAYEDCAIRALRAGREIVDAVAKLGIRVRIGIDTGQVAVSEGRPVGDAVHFAHRLQTRAEPGTMRVSEATRRIVKGKFDFELVEETLDLKGFDNPGAVYRLLGEARSVGADPLDTAARLTPFIGREHELELLEGHWAAARAGGFRAVLVTGDAGIGKSRLAREFRRELLLHDQRAIEFRCMPEHANSAFHPVIDFLRRSLRIQDGDSVEGKLAKIDAVLSQVRDMANALPLIANLLSIPIESRFPKLPLPAEKQRQLTLDVLVTCIRQEAATSAICFIVEDIHWIDPSTMEFLNRIFLGAAHLPLLVLITQRPDSARYWNSRFPVHEIELKGLSPESSRAMVVGACGDSKLPGEIVRLLAARADGVPLFIEESAKMAVDLGVGTEARDAASLLKLTVPATIQDLLMARLDRLETAKPVAQVGGTIGREFSFALLDAVLAHDKSPVRIDNLAARLDTLVEAGLLIEKGTAPHQSYFFKHALIRDAAYQSLWERDRRRLHRTIAAVIGEKFEGLEESQPELLAYHYAEAGMELQALAYWERAARRAASRSAHFEAISHLTNGLEIAGRLDQTPDRNRIELRLQLLMAGRLIATDGYGADRVERVYTRALELCREVRDDNALLKVQMGLEGYHFMRANFDKAHEIANQVAMSLTRSPDEMRGLQSKWAIANILIHQGEMALAVERMDACLDRYDKAQHRQDAVQDIGVMCLCYSSWGKWQLGYPDNALQRAEKVVKLSTELDHPFSMGEAYGFRAAIRHFRGEAEAARQDAEHAIKICDEHGFAVWLAHAKLMHGRALAELGEPAAGIEEMREAYAMWASTGAVVTTPFYLAMQAEGLALAGRSDDGLVLLETAIDIVRKCGERYYEAEIHRLFGVLILQSAAMRGIDRNGEAERWFLSGLAAAEAATLQSLKLRCAISLGCLWASQGRPEQAMQILAPTYSWFNEGAGTRDLVLARRLLDELRPACARS
jgi:class 3 adenylate cyclase/predicted ATPase